MFITTNTSSYLPTFVKPQTQKPEETQEFASRLSAEAPKTSIIQKQIQEFPQGLLQDIENLSNLMLDVDTYTKAGKARGAIYSNGNGNTSFVLGGYEYVLSKTDENVRLDDLMASGYFYSKSTHHAPLRDNNDEKHYRPFAINFSSSSETYVPSESFPEELNKQPDMGYRYTDVENSLKTIEKLLDKQLLAEYEKNPRSDETQRLLFLKSQIKAMPEVLEKEKRMIQENIESILNGTDGMLIETTINMYRDLWANQTSMLAEFSLNLNQFLSKEEQQQVIDSLNVIFNYSDHRWFENLGVQASLLKDTTASKLKESAQDFRENLVTRFSAIDNTETLLNLTSDSLNLQNHAKESKSYESLIDTIRAKLKTTDDSILQKLMSSKTTNQAKVAEVSA